MRCPKHKEGDVCEVEELHYGSTTYTVQKSDHELADKYGAGSKIVYRLLCATHNIIFSSEEYDKDGWKSCRCERCQERYEEFQNKVAQQQSRGIPRWEPRTISEVPEFEQIPF